MHLLRQHEANAHDDRDKGNQTDDDIPDHSNLHEAGA